MGSDFSDHDLRLANLIAANLEGTLLARAALAGAKLHSSRLRHATLDEADLSQVAARDVDFEGASLRGTDLRGADLRGCVLLEADLRNADLRDANLTHADLRGADLTGAQLDGAILDGADLARAQLGSGSAVGISARSARTQRTTGDLVIALKQAGAMSRPPLSAGTAIATIGVTLSRVLSAVVNLLRQTAAALKPAAAVIRPWIAPLGPLAGAAKARLSAWLLATRSLPSRGSDLLFRLAKRLGSGALKGRSLAARVRQEAQERLRLAAEERATRAALKVERDRLNREARAARRQEQLPGGPGADLSGQDFTGARLAFVLWPQVDLHEATLKGAVLDKADLRKANLKSSNCIGARLGEADLRDASLIQADMEGVRLRGALLNRAKGQDINLTDADLRGADLSNMDLTQARLSGADLRGARLSGVCLRDADLTGARLPDVDLVDAILDGANFDQADVAGIRWGAASAIDADLRGALGLGTREREALRLVGAQVDDIHLERLLGRIGARPVQMGAGILAVGMAAYLAARFMGTEVINPAQIEVQAQALRETDPLAASQRYTELASLARRIEDQVGYLVEAALMAEASGSAEDAEELLREALDIAEPKPSLMNETQLRLAVFLHTNQRWADSLEAVSTLIGEVDQPTEQRARAIVLFDKNRNALGLTGPSPRDDLFSSMGDLPETQADLHLALAELYTNGGDTALALSEIEAADTLDIPDDLRLRLMESRARILDRTGDVEGSIKVWTTVLEASDSGSISAQAAPLAISDLHFRAGRIRTAAQYVDRVLQGKTDDRIRGRALLVKARISEKDGKLQSALKAYRSVLEIPDLDTETLDEARIAMASLVLSDQGTDEAKSLLNDLDPDAISEVLAHAKLGEARRLLDAGDAAKAHPIFDELVSIDGLPTPVRRASRAGLGEALAQMGELRDALDIWRELLAEPGSTHDRIQLELLVANGLLQGGRRKEASTAFRSLADSDNTEARVQGLIGLAEVARSSDERERAKSLYRQVADQETDPIWKVRALQELADMAAERLDNTAVVQITRELLGALPPGHVSAPNARIALVSALMLSQELEEAGRICQVALDAAPNPDSKQSTQVACAEVAERAGNYNAALAGFSNVLNGEAPEDVHADAALGIARSAFALDQPDKLIEPIQAALARSKTPALRLPLLTMQIRAYKALSQPVEMAAAAAERDAIAEQIPEVAWTTFIESAGQSRSAGDPETAVTLLRRAMDLPISNSQRATVSVELGSALIDVGDLDAARKRFQQIKQLTEDDTAPIFYAAMGMAEIERRLGHPRLALEWLNEATPPDEAETHAWMAAKATALTEAGDPKAEAAWAALAAQGDTDSETRYTAVKGQADALLGEDKAEQALPLYERARSLAVEDWQAGWANIGMAAALAETGDTEASITLLDELRSHSDVEVRMEATLRRSQLAADQDDWTGALRALDPRAAIELGPAWDASATNARTRALVGAGDTSGANAAWRALAARWPDEEEAVLPAWIALAQLALDYGEKDEAHHWARKAFKEARDPGYRNQAKAIVNALDE